MCPLLCKKSQAVLQQTQRAIFDGVNQMNLCCIMHLNDMLPTLNNVEGGMDHISIETSGCKILHLSVRH